MREEIARIPGTVDVTLFQPNDYPEIDVNVDRLKAQLAGLTQRDVAGDMLVSLSGQWLARPESMGGSCQWRQLQHIGSDAAVSN
jgi:multidrug efflux pump subunit AcrB